ncbi:hypothetical protein DPEC_G00269280 [Dallia pectoralis]|uniref:Uncharacterized protein n=1 Tax=Dallia pectoralis TaxID=75939 RepID=A0ACC2FP81_DALPE|nr:hypothetical protein DPEC_G00269280 [Dallia pectoralis]
MAFIPGQPVTAVVQQVEICKLRDGDHLILGFSIGGGIDQDPFQNPFCEDKSDKGIYVTRVTPGGPADIAGLMTGDKIMQVNGYDMTMAKHDQARKWLTKRNEEVVRLLRHPVHKHSQTFYTLLYQILYYSVFENLTSVNVEDLAFWILIVCGLLVHLRELIVSIGTLG